jgi:D-tyrosyl-tRNA(Tyr) deacylase
MKALIQRVQRGRVTVDGGVVGEIGRGYVALLGVRPGDTEADARHLAQRTVSLRVFADANGKMNLCVQDVGGGILVVSQFTLYADTRKGNRPSFIGAAPPDAAETLYGVYVDALRRALGEQRVATGRFGAAMVVEIVNDGPVTIELNTDGDGRGAEGKPAGSPRDEHCRPRAERAPERSGTSPPAG